MSRNNTLVMFASCVAIFVLSNLAVAQDVVQEVAQDVVQDENGVSTNYFNEEVAPDTGYVSRFGYPTCCSAQAKGCCGSLAACLENCKKHWQHTMAVAAKVEARNQAWPKPFQCADRQLYFAMWEPGIQAGFASQATLSAEHFDKNSELNGLGRSTVSMIMNNMPIGQRNVFIHKSGNAEISDARMAHVKQIVDTWYASRGGSQVVFTDRRPISGSGQRYDTINKSYEANTPAPVIAVATGTTSTSDTGQ